MVPSHNIITLSLKHRAYFFFFILYYNRESREHKRLGAKFITSAQFVHSIFMKHWIYVQYTLQFLCCSASSLPTIFQRFWYVEEWTSSTNSMVKELKKENNRCIYLLYRLSGFQNVVSIRVSNIWHLTYRTLKKL